MTEIADVVVIGAGSAGAVIAARASEDPNRAVLLLEAGPDYPDLASTPYDLVNSHNNSLRDHDWGFSYQPTATGRSTAFPRGRVTGGSSAVNTTIALRGMPEDYDEWASFGNPEWAWEKVLPAFKRLERDLDYGDEPYHGDAGPITIRRYPWDELLPQHQAFLEASRTLGYPDCPDANDPEAFGAGPQPMNKLGRLRVSTAVGYLAPARVRPNMKIRPNTHVRRMLITDGRCSGVEVENGDGSIAVIEGRLFVLCAGAIQTPPILMRSGLGPRGQLESFGIEVIRDTPGVGANFSDHPALGISCAAKDGVPVDPDLPLIQTILRYTAPGSDKRNDLQIEMISFRQRAEAGGFVSIAAVLEYEYGRGTLSLASADSHVAPLIEQRFCEDERDLSRLVACYKDTLAFASAKPLSDMIERVVFPNPDLPIDDETIGNLLRRLSASGFHPCGTAKMGPSSDPMAVVDQYGLVHGVDGLAVADASIMPGVPRANTNLTSIMIGEMFGERVRTRPGVYGL